MNLIRLVAVATLLLHSFSLSAITLIPAPPKLAATGYILMDHLSGQILASENPDARLEPASLTKIMTSYVVFYELETGHVRLNEKVRVSEKAWRAPGSRMFIKEGTEVTVEKLLKGMIIQSGNDASIALAEFTAGSEEAFVDLMNSHASELGLNNSHFANSTGLPHADHYTTPRDVAKLSSALIKRFPEYYKWFSVKKYTYNKITQNNRNLLLFRDKSVDGLKTGHTNAAGYCLVATAIRNDMRLITVVMGTKSERARADESQKLLNYGFRFYETHRLYGADEKIKQIRIWQGGQESLALGVDKELYVTVPRGQYKKLSASMMINQAVIAPVKAGATLGHIEIKLGDKLVAQPKLIALHSVTEGGLFQKLKDKLLLMLE
ncbi:MAG TPA: D-alanyl-D-alanine carboxypeptidase [Ectothiorhodospiraceae bacterium]|nr:D-alanyl-D-alanine carboxypeptidase [Ectothiorhodospiraceae bacterium]